ncbi:MAG TPA: sulfite oxidase-like oxidoreductase [Thermoanaerobaculia bacterium]|nr:sulfite oxidase-like oxidoreductase [Thermoanaerobaculia bacterium]
MDDSIRTGKERVPPGQYVTNKWPVLTYGSTPHVKPEDWTLRVFGLVEAEETFPWSRFEALPRVRFAADFHCVTRFSTLDNPWEGVATREILHHVRVSPEASHVLVHCYGGYTTNLPLEDFLSEHALFADRHGDEPLAVDHGGPVRLVVPHLYAWKSAKWVNGIELLDEDRRGFWEENGYHTYGDPWREERFSHQETREAYQVRRRAKELGLVPGE